MTLQELSDAMNRLRNAAWGRGVTPIASADLAAQVQAAYDRWRAWLDSQSLFNTMTEELAPLHSESVRNVIRTHNNFAKALRGEGIDIADIDGGDMLDAMGKAAETAVGVSKAVLWVVGGAAALGLAFMLTKGRR